jgi:hypothetical protein
MSEVYLYCWSRNIVATANMGCQLDLKAIAMQARNAEYNPKVSRTLHCVLVGVFIVQNEHRPRALQIVCSARCDLCGLCRYHCDDFPLLSAVCDQRFLVSRGLVSKRSEMKALLFFAEICCGYHSNT